MKQLLALAITLLLSAGVVRAQGTAWNLDKAHSRLGFTVTHLVITEVEGTFGDYTVTMRADRPDFADATIDVTVKTATVNTGEAKRDEHLRSDDFFASAKFPVMTFKGKSLRSVGEKAYKLDGELTIRDVTKPVTLDVTYTGAAKDPWGNTKAGFKLSGTINRYDFGLKWNKALEAGGVLVSEDVTITGVMQLARSAAQ